MSAQSLLSARLFAIAAAGMLLCAHPAAAAPASNPAEQATPLSVERAYEELAGGDWILQARAMSLLVKWNHKDAPAAVKALAENKDAKPWVRGRALVALAQLRGQQALDAVLPQASAPDPDMRAGAVEALAVIGSPRGLPVVESALSDKAPIVRHAAVVAYARLQRQKALAKISPLADQDDPPLVRAVAAALVYVDSPQGLERLLGLLKHKDRTVRSAAAGALAQVGKPAVVMPLLTTMAKDPDADVRAACRASLESLPPGVATEPLLGVLKSDSVELYGPVLDLLAKNPSADACRAVASLLLSPPDRYKLAVPAMLKLLARAPDPDDFQSSFKLYLESTISPEARQAAVEGLGKCPQAPLFVLLKPKLSDAAAPVRLAAMAALQESQTQPPEGVVEYLSEVLAKGDADMRTRALALLQARMTAKELPKALEALKALLGGADEAARAKAARALENAADDEGKRLIAASQGYITRWMMIGPFPDRASDRLAIVYPPELDGDFAKRHEAFRLSDGAEFKVADSMCGGVERKSIEIRPPQEGRERAGSVTASIALALPRQRDLSLRLSHGLLDTNDADAAARLVVQIDSKDLLDVKNDKPDGWHDATVNLDDYAGKNVTLNVTVEGLGKVAGNIMAIAEPKVVSGTSVVADLLAMAPSVPVQSVLGDRPMTLGWVYQPAASSDGRLQLHQVFSPANESLAYAVALIKSDSRQTVQLVIEADDAVTLWLNDKNVGKQLKMEPLKVQADLQAGGNRLLVKCGNREGVWAFSVRAVDPKTGAAASGISEGIAAPASVSSGD
jgi:HEAT repeat protein